jgi:hypothetical protein
LHLIRTTQFLQNSELAIGRKSLIV